MDFAIRNSREQFQHRLAETITWCTFQDWSANPAEGLRTALLRPSEQAKRLQTFHDSDTFWKKTPQQWQQLVEHLALQRVELLHKRDLSLYLPAEPLNGGRLLAFSPENTLSDGAANFNTDGFFDDDNIPPWDTWIWYVTNDPVNNFEWWRGCDSYLLSWVPDSLVEVIASGIGVNPEQCIQWATDLDTPFLQQLKQAGFIR